MKVVCADVLKTWLRKEHWWGDDAAHILSDLDPDWTDYEGSNLLEGHIIRCKSFCQRTNEEFSAFVTGREEYQLALNRFEVSINDKVDLMRQKFEDGERTLQTPRKWISWAIEKNFKINWLMFALNEGFFSSIKKEIDADETLQKTYIHIIPIVPAISEPIPVQKPESNKPLNSRERNNLLKVIAALCKEQNLSLDMPFKAAGIVENQIKSLGLSLGNDTIALILSDAEKLIKSVKIS